MKYPQAPPGGHAAGAAARPPPPTAGPARPPPGWSPGVIALGTVLLSSATCR